jgi:hypothetical protein
MKNLYTKALLSLVALAVSMGLLLLAPAGTAQYWQAWLYLGIFTGASLLTILYLIKNDPALLKRRMTGGPAAEKETTGTRSHGQTLPQAMVHRNCQNFYASFLVGAVLPLEANGR